MNAVPIFLMVKAIGDFDIGYPSWLDRVVAAGSWIGGAAVTTGGGEAACAAAGAELRGAGAL